jgi:hypothetical protein
LTIEQLYKSAAATYRNIGGRNIEFAIPPSGWLDLDAIEALEDSIKGASNSCWHKARATEDLGQLIPEDPGLYMFIWAPNFRFRREDDKVLRPRHIVYIGQAGHNSQGTLRARYQQEYAKLVHSNPNIHWEQMEPDKTRESRVGRHLNLFPLEYWWLPCHQTSMLGFLEAELINLFHPPANMKIHRVRASAGRTVRAFK